MEGLLPLLIAVIVSIALSRKKKKPTLDNYPPAPQDSPWDDILREIARGAESERNAEFEENQDDYIEDYEEYVNPRNQKVPGRVERSEAETIRGQQTNPFPTLQPSIPMPTPVAVSAPVYAQASIPDVTTDAELEKTYLSYEDMDEEQFNLEKMKRVIDLDSDEYQTVNTSLFPHGFDPRDGVLYAEIMTPKFK